MPVAIVSDTCHYLPAELVVVNEIHEVSLYVHRGGEARRESEITDYDAYYRELARTPSCRRPRSHRSATSWRSIEPLLESGSEIVSIHLAGGMSGTVRSAELAREQLGDAAARVRVIDSETACGGEGLVLLAAAAAARTGADADAVVARAQQARAALKLWFAIDTLEYLRRGGRIAGAQAWLGNGAEDQADPVRGVGDHPGRAGPDVAEGVRAPRDVARGLPPRRRRRAG